MELIKRTKNDVAREKLEEMWKRGEEVTREDVKGIYGVKSEAWVDTHWETYREWVEAKEKEGYERVEGMITKEEEVRKEPKLVLIKKEGVGVGCKDAGVCFVDYSIDELQGKGEGEEVRKEEEVEKRSLRIRKEEVSREYFLVDEYGVEEELECVVSTEVAMVFKRLGVGETIIEEGDENL